MISRRHFLALTAWISQFRAPAQTSIPNPDLAANFRTPPPGYGPVPFWWWTGEPLDRERLIWQLDRLHSQGVTGMNVSYNHDHNGVTDVNDPPLFSEEWWEIWRAMVEECRQRGMSLGFEDYTLTWPDRGMVTVRLMRERPELRGHQLSHLTARVGSGETPKLEIPEDAEVLSVTAYPLRGNSLDTAAAIDLRPHVASRRLSWQVPRGEFTVVAVLSKPDGLDAMHPDVGSVVIEHYWREFERHTPAGVFGTAANYFFQDEFMFGKGMPYYSPVLAGEFRRRKGYDLAPWLPALWHDLGPQTPKVRLDYSDVVTSLMEERYFQPIFEWATKRNLIYGHDQAARGEVVHGALHYGDYFRTMRWYTAPGNDDPGPADQRPVNRTKVSSSISHLYRRPRTWLEGYHSSGWGVTPERIIAWMNQNYAFGSTLLNLHGLYYTTYGTWWEWAPPDFHFRQPFWEHMGAFSGYVSRLSWLLSQGVHRCDVAIVYPSAAAEAGMDGERAEKDSFGLGEHLFHRAIDFDYIDHQSLERAEIRGRELQVAGEAYRVLVIASMRAVRQSTLEKAMAFHRAGGLVILYGALPEATDTLGRDEGKLRSLLSGIPQVGEGFEAVSQRIDQTIERDFVPSREDVFVLHRVIGETDVYLVNNIRNHAIDVDAVFRAKGRVERWDGWTGEGKAVAESNPEAKGTRVALSLAAREAQLIVFHRNQEAGRPVPRQAHTAETVIALDGAWEFEPKPTMDNRYGDYRLPATPALLGPEARRFRYREETSPEPGWQAVDIDDSKWPETIYSFGPRAWVLGPFAPGTDVSRLETELRLMERVDPSIPAEAAGKKVSWKPYVFSLRWGIERDPQLLDKMTGPHGLKKIVPDDFLDLGESAPGSLWYVFQAANEPAGGNGFLFAGSRAEYTAWFNGMDILSQTRSEPVMTRSVWHLPDYTLPFRSTPIRLERGLNRVLLKLVQPEKQRLRAYAVMHKNADAIASKGLGLRWFASPDAVVPDIEPWAVPRPTWYRFLSPPGLRTLRVKARGAFRVWTNGVEAAVSGEEATVANPKAGPVVVAIRIQPEQGCHAGAALPEPVELVCGPGSAPLGDWSKFGLATYSGAAWYRRLFALTANQVKDRVTLDLGTVAATAHVRVNGKAAGTRIAPPWSLDITKFVREGENQLEIEVANTLANHYSVGTPTSYVFEGQTVSGLLGPVRVEVGANGGKLRE